MVDAYTSLDAVESMPYYTLLEQGLEHAISR